MMYNWMKQLLIHIKPSNIPSKPIKSEKLMILLST